jgi:hypothetical protein
MINMIRHLVGSLAMVSLMAQMLSAQSTAFRPPAIPLVTHDPYFSIWSFADRPTDDITRHWTGKTNGMCCMAIIDGACLRLLGTYPGDVPAMKETSSTISPTRTVFDFSGNGVALTMSFLSPLLPDSLDLFSRPLTYISWSVRSTDGKPHRVRVYFDHTAELCLNTADQDVSWSRVRLQGLDVMRMGSTQQPVLQKKGDDVRIDWGYVYLAAPLSPHYTSAIGSAWDLRDQFRHQGTVPLSDDASGHTSGNDRWPVQSCVLDFGEVGSTPAGSFVMLAYDDLYAIEFMHRRLPGYWTRDGRTIGDILLEGAASYVSVARRCADFDSAFSQRCRDRGGADYATLCALAYRHAMAAHKLTTDINGDPLLFPKENFSNGCISTVDVIYPSAPIFLATNPALLEALLRPVCEYAMLPRWRFPFAPHDIGTYPLANGQVYGGGEKEEANQMPVEESGNMIILTYALSRASGSVAFAKTYKVLLKAWAEYLREKGLDPENQLCTDDFTGHLAHNTNLSVKAIVALGCYARLCALLGETQEATSYIALASRYAGEWEMMANDGDHYRLAFDKPGTWSMKYNMVWDVLLGLHLFSPGVAKKELAYYQKKMNAYGLPLDNRADFTKPEWMMWAATMSNDKAVIGTYATKILAYANETPDRVPLSDWYDTKTARKVGFQARSVLGGLFIPLLERVK